MTPRFAHAALIGKHQMPGPQPLLAEIAAFLRSRGLQVSLDHEAARQTGADDAAALSLAQIGAQCDLAVVVGGDGTMLGIARALAPFDVALVGINLGRLGFITDVRAAEWEAALGAIVMGDFETERRGLIEGGIWRGGQPAEQGLALNDVVVGRGATSSMIEVRVDVGEEFVAHMRADGIIVATPTGATAYALSAGGPILHPSIAGWVLVPIASHTLSNRPIVLPNDQPVRLTIVSADDVSANFDMHSVTALKPGDEVRVWRSQLSARFVHPRGWSYYATLRRKLRWYEGTAS